jgi:ATP-dependent protease HslVU (ClpYQ) peptidase subunit
MTTIVWDGKTLAADGRMTSHNRVLQDNRLKIFVTEGLDIRGDEVICYAHTGDADMTYRILTWMAEGCQHTIEGRPVDWGDADFGVVIITRSHAYVYASESNDLLELETSEAMGSGRDFAEVALHLGKDAKASVKLAAEMDIFSGGTGTYINCRVKHPKLKEFQC